jgi:hypothetical protein
MKSPRFLLAAIVAAMLVLVTSVPAGARVVIRGPVVHYRSCSPHMGRTAWTGSTENPWTGTAVRGVQVYNPWTGRATAAGVRYNPWTGQRHWGVARW